MARGVSGAVSDTPKPKQKSWVLAKNFGWVDGLTHHFHNKDTPLTEAQALYLRRLGAEVVEIEV